MDDIAAQEAAMRQAYAHAKPRELRRNLQKSLARVSQREAIYEDMLAKKSFDKSSSMFLSPVKTRPKTTNSALRSTRYNREEEDGELLICRDSGDRNNVNSTSSPVSLSLSSLRPAVRTSKAFAKPPPVHLKPTLPSTTPSLLPAGSPIARAVTPYYQKTKGSIQLRNFATQNAIILKKRHRKKLRHDFLYHDPGLSPAANSSTVSVPFLQNPQFYQNPTTQYQRNPDGIKEVNHHETFYCRK